MSTAKVELVHIWLLYTNCMEWILWIYIILLLDAFMANYLAWSDKQHWWQKNLGNFAEYFPLARGWSMYYLVLVGVMGIILWHTDLLVLPF